tara:strand:- start:1918 stop:2109 length:192 start_codon:yes stop_codon:yes gene_type:complete
MNNALQRIYEYFDEGAKVKVTLNTGCLEIGKIIESDHRMFELVRDDDSCTIIKVLEVKDIEEV